MTLPPLPEPQWHDCSPTNAAHMPHYTAEQMRERDRAIVELCIVEIDRVVGFYWKQHRQIAPHSALTDALRSLLTKEKP